MYYLDKLTDSHKNALEWLAINAEKEIPWTGTLDDGTFLFTKAKGIYKPKNSKYALIIRHNPKTEYKDVCILGLHRKALSAAPDDCLR
jgi:hypothetical protein